MERISLAQLSSVQDFYTNNKQETHLERRFATFAKTATRSETPPFPRYLMVEVTNICNHACVFCAYTQMERSKRQMEAELFYRLAREAYELGAREIGLFSGAEPLTCKNLVSYARFCSELGYEYLYMTTNGSLADKSRLKELIDAGLTSIKFSVNGGTRATYKTIHGKDDFDKVIRNIRFVCDYRKTLPRKLFVGVSFVEVAENKGTFENLKAMFEPLVDEIVLYQANNQSGQLPQRSKPDFEECDLPFNRIHISREGYLRACCNDYENALAMEDLNHVSLADAWHGERFRALRRGHLQNNVEGSLCHNCLNGTCDKVEPLNAALGAAPKLRYTA